MSHPRSLGCGPIGERAQPWTESVDLEFTLNASTIARRRSILPVAWMRAYWGKSPPIDWESMTVRTVSGKIR